MLLEAFSQTILRWLRIPPGTALRKADGPTTSSGWANAVQNEYINAMLDITVDDICINDSPLSINYDQDTPEKEAAKLKDIIKEFNTIAKWAVKDLCAKGYSVYDVSVTKKNKLILLPYLKDVKFYLSKEKKVLVCNADDDKTLKNKLIFVYYDKDALSDSDAKNDQIAFNLTPTPMQMRNADLTVSGIQNAENSIARYRTQLGRLVRIANVDIGVAQGDAQKDVVDGIAEAINPDSTSLQGGTPYTDYDDNIPVLPNRKGLGKVDIQDSIPNVNIKDLADLDYWIGKLALIMRFPVSYLDFTKNLDATAVSMIRGDLRYSKMCRSVASKFENTVTDYLNESKFKKYHPVASLAKLPSSEDDDVISALDNYVEIAGKVEDFIIGDDKDKAAQLHRLELLQDLIGTSTNSPALQAWFEDFTKYINESGEHEAAPALEGSASSAARDRTPEPTESDLNLDEDLNLDTDINPEDVVSDINEVPEGEFIPPQTE